MGDVDAIIRHINEKGFYVTYYGNSMLTIKECDDVAEATGIARTVVLRAFYDVKRRNSNK
jgi:hypothetical protein